MSSPEKYSLIVTLPVLPVIKGYYCLRENNYSHWSEEAEVGKNQLNIIIYYKYLSKYIIIHNTHI